VNHDALRIIDAALNRATEGLRVVEDYVRFVLDDRLLTGEVKALRHDLAEAGTAAVSAADRHAARDTVGDVGARISTTAERRRGNAWEVCAASFKRAEQALRSLEEFGKLVDGEFAGQCEAIRYRLYTLEKATDIGRTSGERLAEVRLCVLVDGRGSPAEFEQAVQELVAAGVGMIQLRDKGLDDRELVERAKTLVKITREQTYARDRGGAGLPPAEPGASERVRHSTLAIVNDRVDVAAIVGADGVHLGQEDMTVKDARAVVGPRMLIGVSTHNVAQARTAVLEGANYLGAGPTFPSRTKAFDDFAGLDYLRTAAAETQLPTFAIGGITADNLPEVQATGVRRVAVGAAVTEAAEPGVAAHKLLVMLEDSVVRPTADTVSPSGS
jgi:thiamine-phosphate pyrophosphorylase